MNRLKKFLSIVEGPEKISPYFKSDHFFLIYDGIFQLDQKKTDPKKSLVSKIIPFMPIDHMEDFLKVHKYVHI